jgi:hypothetical protein
MAHELDWAWIVVRVAGHDGCDLCYAALCLTPQFKKSFRKALQAWGAAAEWLGNEAFSLDMWNYEVMWLEGDPGGWNDALPGDAYDWVLAPGEDKIAELVCTPEEIAQNRQLAMDNVLARTTTEKMHLKGGAAPWVFFTCYEKHGSEEISTDSLPSWVISWAMEEDDSDSSNNNTEVQDGE